MQEKSLQFLISLRDTDPLVWRQIIIPENYTFFQLHMAIQGAFGWSNCHLFQFCDNDVMDKETIGIPYDGAKEDGLKITDAKNVLVREIFNKKGARYSYLYDLGDGWLHEVLFEKKVDQSVCCPFCIDAANACPPDDVGGIGGYYQMVKAYHDKNKEEIASYAAWLGLEKGERWRAEFCSRREINLRLALLGG